MWGIRPLGRRTAAEEPPPPAQRRVTKRRPERAEGGQPHMTAAPVAKKRAPAPVLDEEVAQLMEAEAAEAAAEEKELAAAQPEPVLSFAVPFDEEMPLVDDFDLG